jgi:hypothetical protein
LPALVVLAVMTPLMGHRLVERFARWLAARKGVESRSIQFPPTSYLALAGLLFVINFLFFGWMLSLLAEHVFATPNADVLIMTGVFAAAWVIGFVSPGAPAGLGVRELVLILALTPLCGKEVSIGLAGILRLLTTVGDGFCFLVGLLLLNKQNFTERGGRVR